MLVFGAFFGGVACSEQEAASDSSDAVSKDANTAPLSIEKQAWRAIHAGAQLIDVRTPGEVKHGYLNGAINIPHDQIEARIGEVDNDKDRTIVIYCHSGVRSGFAKQILEGLGYTHVINGGGYESLKRAQ